MNALLSLFPFPPTEELIDTQTNLKEEIGLQSLGSISLMLVEIFIVKYYFWPAVISCVIDSKTAHEVNYFALVLPLLWLLYYSEVSCVKRRIRTDYKETMHASGEGSGTPMQYSRLKNSMDGGAW